jgi:hypothetical protein
MAEGIARMERDLTLAKLRRSGAQVVEWDVAGPLWQTLKRAGAGIRR